MTIYTRLEKIIKKTWYREETLVSNLKIYLDLKTITEDEYNSLIALIEEYPGTAEEDIAIYRTNDVYLMLERQIEKTTYTAEQISEMVTNFSLSKTLSDSELVILANKIKEKYFPVIDSPEDEITDPEI